MTYEVWPDDSFQQQAGRIGSALLELIDAETRWVHRRVERFELANAAQATRSIATDLSVPMALVNRLRLYASPLASDVGPDGTPPAPDIQTESASHSRIIVPLGTLRKAPLEDFSLTPSECQRLSADQTRPLLVSALAPFARACGADPQELLTLLAKIVRSETPARDAQAKLEQVLKTAEANDDGDADARARVRRLATILSDHYVLLAAVKADPGLPTRVVYTHRQTIDATSGGFGEPPLVISHELPYASGDGPSFRIEIVAPDGLEIETASIGCVEGRRTQRQLEPASAPRAIESENPPPGKGAYVHLKAPAGPARPDEAGLFVTFGFPAGGIHHLALVAGLVSTLALALAVVVSYWFDAKLKGSSAGALLAAPGLVTGLALGFPTTRVTSKAVNRLRLAALGIALLGVLGGLNVALLAESEAHLNLRHGILIGLAILSALALFSGPVAACLRERAKVPPANASSSGS